jgi:formylglycine-generating enzyme
VSGMLESGSLRKLRMLILRPKANPALLRPALNYAALILVAFACGFGVSALSGAGQHDIARRGRQVIEGDGVQGPRGMMWIPGGEFLMGSDDPLAKPNERPAHEVRIQGFWLDRAPVTNAQFAAFVTATRYVTTAERAPDWETLKVQLSPGTPRPAAGALVPGAMVFVGTDRPVDLDDYTQWWRYVPGASWRHPQGPDSSIAGKSEHPVVLVSYEDALAYARWVGKRLPTEAEWEFAARGGLQQATYAWGNEFAPHGQKMANVWDAAAQPFPVVDARVREAQGTSRVCNFPVNGYGLCDMTGNVWQWVADWYRADAFALERRGVEPVDPRGPSDSYDPDEPGVPEQAPKRVIRGGSFLCSREYCQSYRPSARRGNDPYTGMSHIGFRLVLDRPAPGLPGAASVGLAALTLRPARP